MALTLLLPPSTVSVSAAGDTRTLYLRHIHTGETGRFTFKRNGRYDQGVLRQLNTFLADWRNQKVTEMDPALYDLLWMVNQEVGGTQPISIVSSYRSPETNRMLRAKSSGVAENSQHVSGKAIDFYIPGIPLKLVREAAMKRQVGGVGYYPTSGSPFVHLDTGSVRAWPRMTTAQLKKIFPDGRTLHVPTDGRVISAEGRRYAEAEWKKCRMVPCSGASVTPYNEDAPVPATPGRNLMDAIFGNGSDDIQVAVVEAPAQPAIAAAVALDPKAPVPLPRPTTFSAAQTPEAVPFGAPSEPLELADLSLDSDAPMPVQKSPALLAATGVAPEFAGETALAALTNLGAPSPKSRVLMTNPAEEPSVMVTAYVPTMTPDPGAQRALEMIIERETAASLPAPRPASEPMLAAAPVQTASLGDPGTLGALQGLLDTTWEAVTSAVQPPVAAALLARTAPRMNTSFEAAPVELIAPDLEHVAEVLSEPVPFSSRHFSELYDTEGYMAKTTELGSLVTRIVFEPDVPVRAYDRFAPSPLLVVALR